MLRRRHSLSAAGLALIALLLATSGALAADETSFHFELPVGHTVVTEATMQIELTLDLVEEALQLPLSLRAVTEMAYDYPNAEGLIPFIERIAAFEVTIDGFPIPDLPTAEELNMYSSSTPGLMDPQGRIAGLSVPGASGEEFELFEDLFQMISSSYYLPDEPVRVGDEWSVEWGFELPPIAPEVAMEMGMKTNYTFAQFDAESGLATFVYTTDARVTLAAAEEEMEFSFAVLYTDAGEMQVDATTGIAVSNKSTGEITIRFDLPEEALLEMQEMAAEDLADFDALPLALITSLTDMTIPFEASMTVLEVRKNETFPPFPVQPQIDYGTPSDWIGARDEIVWDLPPEIVYEGVRLSEEPPVGKSLVYMMRMSQGVDVYTVAEGFEELQIDMWNQIVYTFDEQDADGNYPFEVLITDGGLSLAPWPEFPSPLVGEKFSGLLGSDYSLVSVEASPNLDEDTFMSFLDQFTALASLEGRHLRIGDQWTEELSIPLSDFGDEIVAEAVYTVTSIDPRAGTVTILNALEAFYETVVETGEAENPVGLIILALTGSGETVIEIETGYLRRAYSQAESVTLAYSGPSLEAVYAAFDSDSLGDAVVIETAEMKLELVDVLGED